MKKILILVRHWERNNFRGNKTIEKCATNVTPLMEYIRKFAYVKKPSYKLVVNFHKDANEYEGDVYNNPYVYAQGSYEDVTSYLNKWKGDVNKVPQPLYIHVESEDPEDKGATYQIQSRTIYEE